jgi:hypothetical protein
MRLFKGQNLVAPLEDTAATRIATGSDVVWRWILRRFLNVLPDFELFGLTDRVAEGFDVALGDLGLRLIVLTAYLLPWAMLAYYLMKSREVASSS